MNNQEKKKPKKNEGKKVVKITKKAKSLKKETEEKPKKKKKKRHIVLITILSLLILIVALVLAFFLYIIISAPEANLDLLYKTNSTILYDINGDEYARLGYEDIDTVTYDDLPEVLVDAIVATEDSRFFQHNGFDIARFIKATIGQLTHQAGAGGASTITMQVVKNTWTNKDDVGGIKGIIRKFTDIYMSIFIIEKKFTKQEIIEFYANMSWLGAGNIWGVERASQLYFGKSVADLSLPEAALLAGLFNNPVYYNPYNSIENATERRNVVLNLMYRHGYITKEQRDSAQAVPVESMLANTEEENSSQYQSFIDTVVDEVQQNTGLNPYFNAMKIYTTLDPRVQDALNTIDDGTINFPDDKVQVAVAVTNPQDGSIVGVFGRRHYSGKSILNLATDKRVIRHPGSTIKPIMDYGPYIEFNNGSPGTYFFDEPMTYSNGQSIKNADDGYTGQTTMRSALSASRNIPALQAFQQTDTDKVIDFVHSLGIHYGETLYESAAIGGFDGVNALEMATAYSSFANGGYYIAPYSYTKIEFIDTGEVVDNKSKKEKVMSEETAYMVTSILMTAFQNHVGASFSTSGTDIASKTGTSTYGGNTTIKYNLKIGASRDNWSITYSPDYTIALWYGYEKLDINDVRYTMSIAGANMTSRLMTKIGKQIYKTNSRFKRPSNVISVEVERDTVPLMLPSANTPSNKRMTELFKKGTEPTEVSKRYETLENPASVTSKVSGTSVTLNWQPISIPWAIDEVSQQEYFNNFKEIFGDTKWMDRVVSKYYDNRMKENAQELGSLTYDIYENGNLIGSTTNTSYTINNASVGNHTYTVKASYTIFKAASSSGVSVKASVEGSSTPTTPETGDDVGIGTITLDESDVSCITLNASYTPKGVIKVLDTKGNDITKNVTITSKIKFNGSETSKVDTSKEGTYTITYTIGYKGKTKTKTKTVNVKTSC